MTVKHGEGGFVCFFFAPPSIAPLCGKDENVVNLASLLHQEELVFCVFLLLLTFTAENKHDLLVDNCALEHALLSSAFKLLLLLLKVQ